MNKKIRVLVVDDSAFIRKAVTQILETDPEIVVIDTASNGIMAVEKTQVLYPDVIVLDVFMPKMDGLTALRQIMEKQPTPVVMLTVADKEEIKVAIRAFERGAVDFVPKPSSGLSITREDMKRLLIEKVKAASKANTKSLINKQQWLEAEIGRKARISSTCVVVIGASAGGPAALSNLLPLLPRDFPACLLIVQHMPQNFTKFFADRLNNYSEIPIKEAEEGDIVRPGRAFIAPGNFHMLVDSITINANYVGIIKLDSGPKVHGVRPSIDILMNSVANLYRTNTVGVLLSGMGKDGCDGLGAIKEMGGLTIVEDQSSCMIFGMPKAAISQGVADIVAPLPEIARVLYEAVKKRADVLDCYSFIEGGEFV